MPPKQKQTSDPSAKPVKAGQRFGTWLGGLLGKSTSSASYQSTSTHLTSDATLDSSSSAVNSRMDTDGAFAAGAGTATQGVGVAPSLVMTQVERSGALAGLSDDAATASATADSGTTNGGSGMSVASGPALGGTAVAGEPEVWPAAQEPLLGHPTYVKVDDLGKGAFGVVQLARNVNTQELVAIKFIKFMDKECFSGYVQSEILNHRLLRHFHVVALKEVFRTRDHLGLVMEYANSKDLLSYVQSRPFRHLDEVATRWFFQQLIIGLDYCHRRGVVNRDIKLDNTLLHMMPGMPLPLIKICDFGFSKGHLMSAPNTKVGSLAYMAPEIITLKAGAYDGKLSDLWSCGVMLYAMLFGQYPFSAPAATTVATHGVSDRMKLQQMAQRIVNAQWDIPADRKVSASCHELLRGILVSNPAKRMTMEQVVVHPWFTTNLPPGALAMNAGVMATAEDKGFQTEEEIKQLLLTCQEEYKARLPRVPSAPLPPGVSPLAAPAAAQLL